MEEYSFNKFLPFLILNFPQKIIFYIVPSFCISHSGSKKSSKILSDLCPQKIQRKWLVLYLYLFL
ncbi:hypothetical protein HMPREF3221_00347 [Fusobacterium nucleatum]|uniref:Uncharacterized protein n=1 Tax=Fusobacterium nucleatum TaxID=851 RepID=A0A133P9A6_FUSNU|nr:hypothetical protein HMPREF3221_00347 [Fusobacterium nucleatum]